MSYETIRRAFRTTAVKALLASAALAACAASAQTAVTVGVDTMANRHAISPLVYGLSIASTADLEALNAPINRLGGNNTSRYNWQANADNRDFDWYFESLPYDSATPGEGGDTFIQQSKSGGAQPMVTIPMIGWVAKLGPNRGRLCSFSIAKYGAQTDADWQWYADAGDGILASDGSYVANDPNDADVPADVTFQQGWVQHITSAWGLSSSGGLRYYVLDNEHSIWQSTHRDVHPVGATMDEILGKMSSYAAMIKALDPGALIVGPEEWGWSGYFYSGYDQQYAAAHGWSSFPDRDNHGGWDYLPWLLYNLQQQSALSGKRLLDVFSVHWYPQGDGAGHYEYSDDVSTATELLRNKSTRSLWDPNYTDASWIGAKVYLIPRIKGWVNSYYPGTMTAITEYNWGAEGYINGATAQADLLGIFGREGLDAATRWTVPASTTPTYKAIQMYRNYDGSKSAFGDVGVTASAPNPDNLSAFAALRSADGTLTVMAINKQLSTATALTLALSNFSSTGTAQRWQLTSSNAITRLSDVTVAVNSFTTTLPAQSITLFVLPQGVPNAPSNLTAAAVSTTQVNLAWTVNSYGEMGFLIERKTGVGSYSQIGTAPAKASSYQDGTASAAASYTYRIRTSGPSGNSGYSNEAAVTMPSVSPGETSGAGHPMTCVKAGGGSVDVTFTSACEATSNAANWGQGPISGALSWTGSQCSLGISGSATITPPALSAGQWDYFVIVGQDSVHEGSYGKSSAGAERPQAASGVGSCEKPQQLNGSCS